MAWKRKKRYRLFGFDYSKPKSYYITIVVKDRKQALGEIIDCKMLLSAIGAFAEELILALSHKKQDVHIDEFQIMPDHVHMIVTLKNTEHTPNYSAATGIQPLIPGSLGSFINHFKGKVTRWCNDQHIEGFAWQLRFNDRIIRNTKEYHAIGRYIRNNVRNWNGGNDT